MKNYDAVDTPESVPTKAYVDARVPAGDSAWTTATLINGWVSLYPPTPVRFRKTSTKLVVIQGHLKSGTSGSVAFVLPAGYRPDVDLSFPMSVDGYMSRCFIYSATGNVLPINMTDGRVVASAEINAIFYAE